MLLRVRTAVAALALAAACLGAQVHEGTKLIEASLIADSETIVPGRGVTVGVRLEIAEGWHTYWENPGDSGIPAEVRWELPGGVRIGDLQWPVPEKVKEPGDLTVYAYKDEVVLLARLYAVPGLDLDEVTLRAAANWLVCRESCIPGDAELSLTLEVADEPVPANTALFAGYRERLPGRPELVEGNPVEKRWEREGRTLYLLLRNVPGEGAIDFFPRPGEGVIAGHAEEVEPGERGGAFSPERVLAVPLEAAPEDLAELDGVLVIEAEPGAARTAWVL